MDDDTDPRMEAIVELFAVVELLLFLSVAVEDTDVIVDGVVVDATLGSSI